jgi:hypothetical protein
VFASPSTDGSRSGRQADNVFLAHRSNGGAFPRRADTQGIRCGRRPSGGPNSHRWYITDGPPSLTSLWSAAMGCNAPIVVDGHPRDGLGSRSQGRLGPAGRHPRRGARRGRVLQCVQIWKRTLPASVNRVLLAPERPAEGVAVSVRGLKVGSCSFDEWLFFKVRKATVGDREGLYRTM